MAIGNGHEIVRALTCGSLFSALLLFGAGCGGGGSTTSAPGVPAATATPPPNATPAPSATPAIGATPTPVPSAVPTSASSAQATTACQFQAADQPVKPAFCETFDAPMGTGNRSGQLNGTVWGVSRALGFTNFGQTQYDAMEASTAMDRCGQTVMVGPEDDVQICNGEVADAVNDLGSVTSLAMYPKQPFDIAGRTGTIAFDVSNDTHGTHRACPELWYTDQPVPAPFTHFSSLQSTPRNGFGVRFAGFCPAGQADCHAYCPSEPLDVGITTVDSANVVNNYVSDDSFTDVGAGPILVKQVNCVKASSGPGDMNHYELRVSQHEIDVYGTDAGTTSPLKEIATITNMSLTLTRGLIWIEDVHYNGNKDGPDQGTHTFTWDNVGFDGPLLPRDLAFDVPDRLQLTGNGLINLGWALFPTDTSPLTLTVPGVTNVANASGALITLRYSTVNPVTLSYRLNGGAVHTEPWAFGACYTQNNEVACGDKTVALPVPLAEVVTGDNAIELTTTDSTVISNVDLVLQGAAGVPNAPAATIARGARRAVLTPRI